ncbi:RipA family octameric membrane protein [Synechococcus elongatus]|uniref:RipA family octameric membrane protein n=1 Tax=Synechococcus elongatus TaxID=32046 RepID=UPI0030CDF0BD
MSDSFEVQNILENKLQGISANAYGSSYSDNILEIYKVYLKTVDNISERREKANSFFLSINTALIALFAKGFFDISLYKFRALIILASAIILCYLWHRIIRSYRDLNSAKFNVIHAIEKHLPIRPYDAEWESIGRGKDPKKYLPFTDIEKCIPWIFISFYLILFLEQICENFK